MTVTRMTNWEEKAREIEDLYPEGPERDFQSFKIGYLSGHPNPDMVSDERLRECFAEAQNFDAMLQNIAFTLRNGDPQGEA